LQKKQMETKEKYVYEAPVVTEVEVGQEGVICTSGTRDDYGKAINEEWE